MDEEAKKLSEQINADQKSQMVHEMRECARQFLKKSKLDPGLADDIDFDISDFEE